MTPVAAILGSGGNQLTPTGASPWTLCRRSGPGAACVIAGRSRGPAEGNAPPPTPSELN